MTLRWITAALLTALWSAPVRAQEEKPRLVVQPPLQAYSLAISPDGKLMASTGALSKGIYVWHAATGRLLRHLRSSEDLQFKGFTPSGRIAARLLLKRPGGILILDPATGRRVKHYPASAIAFSADGSRVATRGTLDRVHVFDVRNNKTIAQFEGRSNASRHVRNQPLELALAPDGRWLAGLGLVDRETAVVRVWDLDSGKLAHEFRTGRSVGSGLTVTRDYLLLFGSRVAKGEAGRDTYRVRARDLRTGKVVREFEGETLALSFDERVLATCGRSGVLVHDFKSGRIIHRCKQPRGGRYRSLAISPDGSRVITSDLSRWAIPSGRRFVPPGPRRRPGSSRQFMAGDGSVIDLNSGLWDGRLGRMVGSTLAYREPDPADPRKRTRWACVRAVSENGNVLVSIPGSRSRNEPAAEILDSSGQTVRKLQYTGRLHTGSCSLSADGAWFVTYCYLDREKENRVVLFDTATGKLAKTLDSGAATVGPRGRLIENHPDEVLVRDLATDNVLLRMPARLSAWHHGVSGDGRRLAALGTKADPRPGLWDLDTGKRLRAFENTELVPMSLSHDGGRMFARLSPLRIKMGPKSSRRAESVWWGAIDTTTGRTLWKRELPTRAGHAVPGGAQWAIFGTPEGTWQLWDVVNGEQSATLAQFEGGWAVIDPEGRYDAANGGVVENLHWVIGNEPIELSQLKERYYDPGLLAKILGFNKEPRRVVKGWANPRLYPDIGLEQRESKLFVKLRNRGGGIGRVVVRINGKEKTADARSAAADPDAPSLELAVDLAGDPRLRPGEENDLEVLAYNAEGYLRSRGVQMTYKAPGKRQTSAELWGIAAGVSDYAGDAIDLRYASKDAEDFAIALRTAAGGLFGEEKTHVELLSDPTTEELVAALDAARAARPDDVLVVYLAGHGVNHGGQEGDYYFLGRSARSANLADPEVRKRVGLSSRELTERIKVIPALKQVLILDTCAAGAFVDKLSVKRDVPGSQVRALERLKDRTGMHILAGCAADRVSYEATRYAQGLLTYSLLLGIRGAALRKEQFVDVSQLFEFAADRVPELAGHIGGVQRPVLARPRGASFSIGRLNDEAKKRIPLRSVRPVVLRSNFQDEDAFRDSLSLAKLVDERLADLSAAGRTAPLVFVAAREFPDAYLVAGRYRVKDGRVTVTVQLFQGDEKRAAFTIQAKLGEAKDLATRIVDEATARLK